VKTADHRTALLGDLIAAAFDTAAQHTPDPREVLRLASEVVMRMLRRHERDLLTRTSRRGRTRSPRARQSATAPSPPPSRTERDERRGGDRGAPVTGHGSP
jgi:hypothetical protein